VDASEAVRRPTVHGTYDYWLGGTMHMRADRELGRAIEEEFPFVPVHVRAAKEFHLRTARWAAERGIDRFVRAGAVSWDGSGRNVHETARSVIPSARTVYVTRDAEAHGWARVLLAGGPGTAAVHATVERPAEVLGAPPVAAMLAEGRPVCLIIGMMLHFTEGGDAAGRVAAYAAALPPGSVVVVSLSLLDDSPRGRRLRAIFTPAPVHRHTAADVTGWLEGAGLEIVPPGVCDVRLLPGCGWAAEKLNPRAPSMIAGALGLVP